jgi:hypothetical protein
MKKPYVTIRLFGGYDEYRKVLNKLGATFKERTFLSNFWGIEFEVEKFYGKGSQEKNRTLMKLADPVDCKEVLF